MNRQWLHILMALSSGSQEIPVAVISERLAAIKKAHPVEYDGGERAGQPSNPGEEYSFRQDPSFFWQCLRSA